ncbi:hypothetical protein ACQKWADRAFT_317710 [Trichoderma austrokoningii]
MTQGEIRMDLIFDTNSDIVLLFNSRGSNSEQPAITVRQLPLSCQDEPTEVEIAECCALKVSSYGIYFSNEHILDITIFPRRYISFVTEPPGRQGTRKRPFGPISSQHGFAANKRAKLTDTSEESSASTIFQTAPTHPLVEESDAPGTPSDVSDSDVSAVPDLCHPLEELRLGSTLKVSSDTREEDYRLTRIANLSVQRNSLVYKAYYSKIPTRLAVAKVWRSIG